MSVTPNVYARARSEIIALFGWNADSLSPDQTLRLDCAVALRLALDDLQARVIRGESVDMNRMLTASEALSRLLPPAVLASPPPAADAPDPRTIMWETYLGMRRRGELADSYRSPQQRLEAARAKVAEIEAELAALAPPSDGPGASSDDQSSVGGNVVPLRVITPPTSDIVPPGEQGVTHIGGPPRGPDDPPVRSTAVIEGKAEKPPRPLRIGEAWSGERGFYPIPPKPNGSPATASAPRTAAPAPSFNYDEAMRYVHPDGSISPVPLVGGGSKYWGPVGS
jgi:hypothetical protein